MRVERRHEASVSQMHGKREEGRDVGDRASKPSNPTTGYEAQPNLAVDEPIQPRQQPDEKVVEDVSNQTSSLSPNHHQFRTSTTYSKNIIVPKRTAGVSYQIMELARLLDKKRKNPIEHWRAKRMSKKLVKAAKIEEIESSNDIRPHLVVTISGEEVRGLLDSGASISCLGKGAFETLQKCNLRWKEIETKVQTASGQQQEVKGYTDVVITYKEMSRPIRLYVIPSLSQSLYLGIDFWIHFNLLPKLEEVEVTQEVAEAADPNLHQLNSVQNKRLNNIISLFPSCEKEGLGKTTLLKHEIDVGSAAPSKQRYYAVSPAIQKTMYEEVDRMLDLGVIEESRSAWSSPVTVVAKANGKSRLCLDARHLNSVTVKDAYPMPLIEGILSRLNETHFISSVDLKDAFWQIELEEQSREKTAFTVPGRPLYQFTRMPFGLCNAAQSMCRLMDLTIPSALREFIFVYIDDLLVVSSNFETHLERLQLVADCLRKSNLTINVGKSKFCMRTIKYLGHIVGNGEIKPDPDRVKSIAEFPQPTTVRQVRRFLGMAGWYQRYIHNYSDVAAPITDLLRNADRFNWNPNAQAAFKALKTCLTTAPVLTHPDFSLPFCIQCDASISGVGGVLFQTKNGEERPIAFMSKKLNSAQRNYTVTELECLAAILCVKRFRCYIEGMEFKIITDHASLKWLMCQKDLTGRLARWSLKLQAFNFSIEHRKGSENIVPDTLSRATVDEINTVSQPLDIADPEFKSESYQQLLEHVKSNQPQLADLRINDNIVYKRIIHGGDTNGASEWKIWVPDGLQEKIIAESHNPPSAAHGGVDKTLDLIRRYHFWPGMSSGVRAFIAQCSLCKETKSPNQTLRPLMGVPLIAERPFQHIYIDLLGPYPRSKLGNSVILIILDQLTKFVWLKPLRKATAITIVKYVEAEIFHLIGAPETILSDNGKQFVSKEFKSLLNRYGVKQIYTATHSPQVNASERVNRSIIAAIRVYIEQDQTRWDVNISAIASALRNATHASTSRSPYFAVYGQHMIQHAAAYPLLHKLKSLESGEIEVLPPSDLRFTLNQEVRNKLQLAQERSRRTYNLKAREVTFRPGQEVFRRSFLQSDATQNFNAKLSKQWLPARIIRKKGSCLYELEDRQGRPIKTAYHAKDIRV